MKLPDGEHLIEDKIYVVKDGEVIEIKDVPTEMSDDIVVEEEVPTEEVVEEETMTEEVEMAVDPAVDAEAIIAIVKPLLEEHMNSVIAMIAGLKNQIEESIALETEEEEVAPVAMSSHDKFKEFVKFSKSK